MADFFDQLDAKKAKKEKSDKKKVGADAVVGADALGLEVIPVDTAEAADASKPAAKKVVKKVVVKKKTEEGGAAATGGDGAATTADDNGNNDDAEKPASGGAAAAATSPTSPTGGSVWGAKPNSIEIIPTNPGAEEDGVFRTGAEKLKMLEAKKAAAAMQLHAVSLEDVAKDGGISRSSTAKSPTTGNTAPSHGMFPAAAGGLSRSLDESGDAGGSGGAYKPGAYKPGMYGSRSTDSLNSAGASASASAGGAAGGGGGGGAASYAEWAAAKKKEDEEKKAAAAAQRERQGQNKPPPPEKAAYKPGAFSGSGAAPRSEQKPLGDVQTTSSSNNNSSSGTPAVSPTTTGASSYKPGAFKASGIKVEQKPIDPVMPVAPLATTPAAAPVTSGGGAAASAAPLALPVGTAPNSYRPGAFKGMSPSGSSAALDESNKGISSDTASSYKPGAFKASGIKPAVAQQSIESPVAAKKAPPPPPAEAAPQPAATAPPAAGSYRPGAFKGAAAVTTSDAPSLSPAAAEVAAGAGAPTGGATAGTYRPGMFKGAGK